MTKIGERFLLLSGSFLVFVLFLSSGVHAQTTYVGSAKCESCHKEIYETWKDTLHNKSQQNVSPSNDSVVVDWKGVVKLPAGLAPLHF